MSVFKCNHYLFMAQIEKFADEKVIQSSMRYPSLIGYYPVVVGYSTKTPKVK